MKYNLLFFFSFILIFIMSYHLFAQTDTTMKVEYYKVNEVRIYINDQSDVIELRKQGLGIEHIKLQDNYFDALLDSFQIEILKKSGYQYEIIIDDVTKDYLERTKESRQKIKLKKPCKSLGFGYGSMGGYYTFSEVVAQLDTMRLLYPNLITVKDSVGTSNQGRTIWAVKISDNPNINENEPEVFYNALIHAREPMGMMTVIYFMYYLLENYGIDPEVKYLVDNRQLYFVPVFNPDGYVYNETISPNGGGMWRKNRRNNGSGLFGVNLNTNFSYKWGYDNIGSSPDPASDNYRGTGPFSEPETQSIREYCIDNNFIISCGYHSYWDVIFPPWGYNLEQTPDSTIFNNLIACANSLNGYRNGIYIPPPENYQVNGYADDWMYGETFEKNKIFGILPEVGNNNDGFWPIPERIFPLAEENLYSNLVYAWGPGIIENPPYISEGTINPKFCRPMIDTLKISATEMNPDNHTSNVYAQLLSLNDSILTDIQLNKVDSSFMGETVLNFSNEDFYKVRFKQNGIDIPSNLNSYGKTILRFTTAGPLQVDSVVLETFTNFRYKVTLFIGNHGFQTQITNIAVKLKCADPWVTTIFPAQRTCPNLSPGQTAGIVAPFAVTYDSATFPGYFNFKFEIMSGGYSYWKDSLQIIPPNDVEDELNPLPTEYLLLQNFSNPFNSSSIIKYSIPKSSQVTLKIFNTLGEEIETLVNEEKPASTYEINWNASTLSSGVYFYELKAGSFIQTRKMILLK